MRKQASIYARLRDETTTVNVLINRPATVADKGFIKEISCTHKDKVVFIAQLGRGLAQDLFFAFKFYGAKRGDAVTVRWIDDRGEIDREQGVIG